MILTKKQDDFARYIFEGKTQREAWIKAGYSSKYPLAMVDSQACRLANKDKIKARVAEFNQMTVDASVATVLERKQILTELARGKLSDFVTVGADGAWFDIDGEKLNSRAIAGATSKTVLGKDGADDAVLIRVHLHDPTKAIDLLNKMDKLYSEIQGNTYNDKAIYFIVTDPSLVEGIKGRLEDATES